MSRIFFAILLTCATLFAGYLGSYTARIGPTDHRNSRGMPLRDVGEILRQDRANYHRFGLRDPEDNGIGYFRSPASRARIPQMVRRGWVEPGLTTKIRYATPLIWVEVYSDRLLIYRGDQLYRQRGLSSASKRTVPQTADHASEKSPLNDEVAVRRDVLARLQAHGPATAFGLHLRHPNAPLVHKVILLQRCRENALDKLFVLAETNMYDDPSIRCPSEKNRCHACSPALSIFIYSKTERGWKTERSLYGALHYGAWGEGPGKDEAAFLHVSPDRCALALRGAYTAQGWHEESYTLYVHEADGFRKVFSTTISLDNGGTLSPEKTDWNTVVRLRPGKKRFYDIHLHRRGVEKNRPADYRVIYRYDGRRYRPDRPDPLNQLD